MRRSLARLLRLAALAGIVGCKAEPVAPHGILPIDYPGRPPVGSPPGPPPDSMLAWTTMSSGTVNGLLDVWGTSATNVYAVGLNGTILHYDGTSWTPQDAGTANDHQAVWGSSATDVFVVGAGGLVFHFDGAAWNPQTPPVVATLAGVWGSSATDVWAVGTGGTIVHFDGTTWSTTPSGTTQALHGVWGTAADDVWAVGDGPTLLHWTGGPSWTVVSPPASGASAYLAISGSAGDSVTSAFIVSDDGSLFGRTADGWSALAHDQTRAGRSLDDVWGTAARDVWSATASDGLLHWDGATWTALPDTPRQPLHAIWGSSATDVFAVGAGGVIVHGTR